MADYILETPQRIENSPNEILLRETLNRNFKKLLDNDEKLMQLYHSLVASGSHIFEYTKNHKYSKGDLVWFLDSNGNLYLLESKKDNNEYYPTMELDDEGLYTFKASYWEDKNELGTLFQTGLSSYCRNKLDQMIEINHSSNIEYHKFGELYSDNLSNDTKILKRDLSNIDENRETNFYPYEVIPLETDNVIQTGSYRLWDNGLIEYDIVFKLGKVGREIYDNGTYDKIQCNNLKLSAASDDLSETDLEYNENSKYFQDSDTYNIFYLEQDSEVSARFGNMIQHNRSGQFNYFSGKLNFPVAFKDLNYMVFTSNIRCQDRDTKVSTIDPGANSIIFTDKCRQSIVALYATYPLDGLNGYKTNGLIVNSFHCQIIGRWK